MHLPPQGLCSGDSWPSFCTRGRPWTLCSSLVLCNLAEGITPAGGPLCEKNQQLRGRSSKLVRAAMQRTASSPGSMSCAGDERNSPEILRRRNMPERGDVLTAGKGEVDWRGRPFGMRVPAGSRISDSREPIEHQDVVHPTTSVARMLHRRFFQTSTSQEFAGAQQPLGTSTGNLHWEHPLGTVDSTIVYIALGLRSNDTWHFQFGSFFSAPPTCPRSCKIVMYSICMVL